MYNLLIYTRKNFEFLDHAFFSWNFVNKLYSSNTSIVLMRAELPNCQSC